MEEFIDYIKCPFCDKKLKTINNTHIKFCCKNFGINTVKEFRNKFGFYACEKYIKILSNNTEKQWKINHSKKCEQVSKGIIRSYNTGRVPYFKGKTKENCKALEVISLKNTGKIRTLEMRKHYSDSKKGNKNPAKREDVRKKIGLGNIRRIAEGRYMPFTDTLPHRTLREAMQKSQIWNGFQNEFPVNVCCIDIANPTKKIAIFVDGNYWHKFPVGRPKDKAHNNYLKKCGWKVLRFWESEINSNSNKCISSIKDIL